LKAMKAFRLLFVALFGLLLLSTVVVKAQAVDDDVEIEDVDVSMEDNSGSDSFGEAVVETKDEDEDGEPPHYLTNIPDPLDGVTVDFVFPDYPEFYYPGGEFIYLVVGVTNGAGKQLNISHIGGSLNHPREFSSHIQNFTMQEVDRTLPKEGRVSCEYVLRVEPVLEDHEFTMAMTIWYNDEQNTTYATTFFNSTILVGTPLDRLSATDLGVRVGALFLVALIGFMGYRAMTAPSYSSAGSSGSSRKSKVAANNSTEEDHDEWLQDTMMASPRNPKSPSRARGRK